MCFSLNGRMTGWQQLEVGIAMGCSISPILFVAAFEIILIGARQMSRGLRSPSGGRLSALRGHMDDVTTILQTAPCTARLLKHLDELIHLHLHLVILQMLLSKATYNWGIHKAINLEEANRQRKRS